jgi:hypothetical protein
MRARNVHLVLSLTMGLVSLQFHWRFDDFLRHASMEWHLFNMAASFRSYPWIQPDERLLSHAPISKTDGASKSQLPTNNILPSKPH